jgi:hypothetical protein
MTLVNASMRPERLSPPCGRGAGEPVSRNRRIHFTAADGAIPNRSAAARRLMPLSTAAITRTRRSWLKGLVMTAGLPRQPPS